MKKISMFDEVAVTKAFEDFRYREVEDHLDERELAERHRPYDDSDFEFWKSIKETKKGE